MDQVYGGIEGFWKCNSCPNTNIADVNRCTGCSEWRDLDWDCTTCAFKNFAKRDACRNCTVARPEAGGYVQQGQGGYDSLQDPYLVVAPQSVKITVDSTTKEEPQYDEEMPWLCGLCHIENTPKRIVCFECSGHRERVEVRNKLRQTLSGPQRLVPSHGTSGAIHTSISKSFAYSAPYNTPQNNDPYNSAYPNPSNYGHYTVRDSNPLAEPYRVQQNSTVCYPVRPNSEVPQTRPEDRSNDWGCRKCGNRNFAKRTKCNKCGNPKIECEDKTVAYLDGELLDRAPPRQTTPYMNHSRRPPLQVTQPPRMRPPVMSNVDRPEDTSQDWRCDSCDNRNFAKRSKCNKCSKPRSDCEDKSKSYITEPIVPRKRGVVTQVAQPLMQFVKQQRVSDPRKEDMSLDWVCGNCNINCFAKKTECFRCLRPRSECELRDVTANSMLGAMIRESPRVSGHNHRLMLNKPPQPPPPPKSKKVVIEDLSNDWYCKICNVNNFAKRLKCFQCVGARKECQQVTEESDVKLNTPEEDISEAS